MVCTGNAARSVMAGLMLERLAELHDLCLTVTTAGTLVVEGQPASLRTRAALAAVPEVGTDAVFGHRSHQLTSADLQAADLVVAMEADHVRHVRRLHAPAAGRTGTLRRLARDLPPASGPLAARVASLGLAEVEVGPDEEVADPAGGSDDDYVACARELWSLCRLLVPRLG